MTEHKLADDLKVYGTVQSSIRWNRSMSARGRLSRSSWTGLKVSTICLGTMQFGWSADEQTAHMIMNEAVELGCNFFDTADIYSTWVDGNPGGVSEKIIGNWLARELCRVIRLSLPPKFAERWARDPTIKGFHAYIS